ncbi:MAG: GatB/YqeY domain-containing protein [Devosiaceae bacterium]|nr:GatB/YqeY domain-containing protein [Devosiaceae bacterium]
MREQLHADLVKSIKAKDKRRSATLRLINAAIKDRDIDARGKGKEPIADADILTLLQKMIKQRDESIEIYAKAGRDDLEQQERDEVAIIKDYLPQPLGEAEVAKEIDLAIEQTGAQSLRDMGKVVGVLKGKFPGRIDFGEASKVVKGKLGG